MNFRLARSVRPALIGALLALAGTGTAWAQACAVVPAPSLPTNGGTPPALPVANVKLPSFVSPTSTGCTAKVIFLTTTGSGRTWTVPADWNSLNNKIEVISAGAGGAGANSSDGTPGTGGGGGGYAAMFNLALTPGASIPYRVGSGGSGGSSGDPASEGGDGGDTWFKGSSVANASAGMLGGGSGDAMDDVWADWDGHDEFGGLAEDGVGTVKISGGGGNKSESYAGTGGGGANGSGNGVDSLWSNVGTGGNGGVNRLNTGGGATGKPGSAGTNGGGGGGGKGGTSGGSSGGAGSSDKIWTQTSDSSQAGPGSGGGGAGSDDDGASTGGSGGNGANYGGGGGGAASAGTSTHGGSGAQGIIVITYTP